MNRVELIGYLIANPELRELSGGGRIAILTVATTVQEATKHELRVERSRVSVSSLDLVAFAEKHLSKGSHVHVEGSLHTRYWVDQNNIDRYSTDVVVNEHNGKLELSRQEPMRAKNQQRANRSIPSPDR